MNEDLSAQMIWIEKFDNFLTDLRLLADRARALGLSRAADTLMNARFNIALANGIVVGER